MRPKLINSALAKLHLEQGDALILDATVFDVQDFRLASAPKDTRLFAVIPREGQTIKDAFLCMCTEEFKKLTREKLLEALNSLGPLTEEELNAATDRTA